jgi:cytochrome c oxidase cbb3-type subunit III
LSGNGRKVNMEMKRVVCRTLVAAGISLASAGECRAQLPDGAGKTTVQNVCGTCHAAEMVLGKAMSREQWNAVVADMVTKGAKIGDADFTQVVDYLVTNLGPAAAGGGRGGGGRGQGRGAAAAPGAPGPGRVGGAGPNDKQIVDAAAADRGRTVYIAECVTCHGPKARGAGDAVPENQKGPDLVRSLTVLHDRYGNTVGPFLRKGHPMQSGRASAGLTGAEVLDLSHFLHQKLDDTLRSGPYSQIQNVLTGDAAACATFFNGAGKCSGCHSPAGDLAGIAKKFDPPTLQQQFVFPRGNGRGGRGGRGGPVTASKPVTVTVTPPSGAAVTGVLVELDDFDVSLRDSSGAYKTWKRVPGLTVEKHDPYQAHIDLLDRYTDKNIHDVVAYLETLK